MSVNDHHRVSPEGRALGASMANLANKASAILALQGEPDERCKSCAFTAGTVPNGCIQTQMDVLKAVTERVPFMCHQPSHNVCHGWYASVVAIKLTEALAAPEQEPVATVIAHQGVVTINGMGKWPEVGTKLYAAPVDIKALTKERDEMRDKYLLGAKLVTDALQRLVDVTKERDALMAKVDRLEARQTSFEKGVTDAGLYLKRERDALLAAAKLAMDVCVDLSGVRMNQMKYLSVLRAIVALKAAGVQ